MDRAVPRRRRPRPVASAGVEALLLRSDELAKGWLLALVEDAPLEDAAAILAGEVARDGPRICDAVVRALAEDSDLRRIERDGVLEPLASRVGEMAGADSAATAAQAVDTLKDIVWSALRRELSLQDEPELLVDAAERLSLVVELVRTAVLRRRESSEAPVAGSGRVAPLRVASPPPEPDGTHEQERRSSPAAAGRRGEAGGAPGLEGTQRSEGVAGDAAVGTGLEEAGARDGVDAREHPGDDSGRDALWVGALRDEIVRAGRARVPLSLLLVELEEAERLLAVESAATASATFGRFAQVVRNSVRRRDVLACETDSRAWIIARDTGRAGAQALGSRIATTVPGEGRWRGAPLTVSVGLAVLGEDGHNAAALIDAAEQTRFAAEASGIGIVGEDGPAGGMEPPPDSPSLAG
jgi:GGDEF domain-containing protein